MKLWRNLKIFWKIPWALKSTGIFENEDYDMVKEVLKLEEEVNYLEAKYRANHIDRLNKFLCQPSAGVLFLDILSNLERVSDHSSNIAFYILKELE